MDDRAGSISEQDVRKVARLARLELSDSQVHGARDHLAAVLGLMATLNAVDVSGVEPLTGPLELTNALRDDVPGPTLSNEALMTMAPDRAEPYVRIPRVMSDSE
jgi:aspartyl-tRNA(Asn)/glutamyl-tRNA(Gln) amidotransferase subunit C